MSGATPPSALSRAAAELAAADAHGVAIVRGVDDVSFLVGDLFREVFGGPPPAEPLHYVAARRLGPGRFEVAGYYHVTYRREYALVGGLCVAPAYRGRGIGERLERIAFTDPRGVKAFFAYVGDPRRARRVGFRDTGREHLLVAWVEDVPDEERERIVAEVAALGPF